VVPRHTTRGDIRGVMPVTRKLRRRGRSVSLPIPKTLLELLQWSDSTVVDIEIAGNLLMVRGRPPPRA
jgi:antitoxin component of MazEF toxin-antitoxin module